MQRKDLAARIRRVFKDENFLALIHDIENLVAKILSIALVLIILVALFDLIIYLFKDIIIDPVGFNQTLIELFGLFLNVLIALELLENITSYLRKHIAKIDLVIVTSLIAVARKIIIFDIDKYSNIDLIALGIAILALSVSYWLIKRISQERQ